jgi:hypothetical protein
VPRHLGEVCVLRREDLSEVAAICKLVMRSSNRVASSTVIGLFERTFRGPWPDPGLLSLVAVDECECLIGFIGTDVHRMGLPERPVCCAGQVSAQAVPSAAPTSIATDAVPAGGGGGGDAFV